MNKKLEMTEETRNRFINTFVQLNKKTDMDKITVKQITEIAGYNRCTFYRYFNDVYAIVETIEAEMIEEITQIIMSNNDGQMPNKQIVDAFAYLHEKNRDKLMIVINPYNRFHFIEQLKKKLIPVFQKAFDIHQTAIRNEYVFDLFFTGVITILSRWIYCQNELEKTELAKIAESFLKNWVLKELSNGCKI